jgi:hypothetical protein
MRRLLFPLLAVLTCAACASEQAADERNRLTGACQVQRCACGPAGWSAFWARGNLPVQWRTNGEPYCPEGYFLHLVQPVPGRTPRLQL